MWLIIPVILALLLFMMYKNSQSKAQGLQHGKLADCPNKPNCISSYAAPDDSHYFPPCKMNSDQFHHLARFLVHEKGIQLMQDENDYLHAVATTRMGFKDDLEFFYNEDWQLLYCRSISRLGYSDLGKNRQRMEYLLNKFTQATHDKAGL